jgi:hypothetical protein
MGLLRRRRSVPTAVVEPDRESVTAWLQGAEDWIEKGHGKMSWLTSTIMGTLMADDSDEQEVLMAPIVALASSTAESSSELPRAFCATGTCFDVSMKPSGSRSAAVRASRTRIAAPKSKARRCLSHRAI